MMESATMHILLTRIDSGGPESDGSDPDSDGDGDGSVDDTSDYGHKLRRKEPQGDRFQLPSP